MRKLTESILNEIIESVTIAVVGELIVSSGEFLKALRRDSGEIPRELGVLRQDHRSTRYEAVDQRLLPHFSSYFSPR